MSAATIADNGGTSRAVLHMRTQFLSSASAYRGNTGDGCGNRRAALILDVGLSAAKLRSSELIARRSSNFDAEPGINGCVRIATCRRISAVTYRTVPCLFGSVLASAHG